MNFMWIFHRDESVTHNTHHHPHTRNHTTAVKRVTNVTVEPQEVDVVAHRTQQLGYNLNVREIFLQK